MSEEFGFTNVGDSGVQPIKVEKKEPTLIKEETAKRERTDLEKEVDEELANIAPEDIDKHFDTENVIHVPAKKKRGRPSKKDNELVSVSFPCQSCRETITDKNVMKIGAGDNRYAAFCPFCQRSLGFIDEVFQSKVADLIKHNPNRVK